jgi:hypothetical protein
LVGFKEVCFTLKYSNELNKITLFSGAILFIFSIVIGILFGTLGSILLGMSLGFLYLSVCIYATILRTPKSIEIQSRKLTLNSYFNGKKEIPLHSLEYLQIHPSDPPQWWKKYLVGGYAKPKNGRVFVFTREIGNVIREAYREEMGHYPPEKPGVVPYN